MASGFLILYALHLAFAQTDEDENVILGRPSDDSIGVHVRAAEGTEVFAEYGPSSGAFVQPYDCSP